MVLTKGELLDSLESEVRLLLHLNFEGRSGEATTAPARSSAA
jgi:hypothetical protein